MPHLALPHWILAIAAAFSIGVSKAGFTGLSLVYVLAFAFLFGARDSTGIVLPMLLVGDIYAVVTFRRHAQWRYIRRMLPPTCLGIVVAAAFMRRLSESTFEPIVGWIILALTVLQLARMWRPGWFGEVPHARWFSLSMGFLAGVMTMLANSAGPLMVLYALALGLPKLELVGTNAWFFLLINAFKVPFSYELGLIHGGSLALNAALVPAVLAGLVSGRWLTHRIPQKLFDGLMLALAGGAAVRLIL